MSTDKLDLELILMRLKRLKRTPMQFLDNTKTYAYNEAICDAIEAVRAVADPTYVKPVAKPCGPGRTTSSGPR